jgi:hypothetical protein
MKQPVFKKIPVTPLREIESNVLSQIGGWEIIGCENSPTIRTELPITEPHVISPLHGRSAWIMDSKWGAVSIKGIGWTIGNIRQLPSPKDARMIFGLYGRKEAEREWQVSQYLRSNDIRATRVLGYTDNFDERQEPLRYLDGSLVHPTLLYTQSISPWRVADLTWMNEAEKIIAFSVIRRALHWNNEDFISRFMSTLSNCMAKYHSLGCINDSLSADNVTLAAEVTDFEWFGTPFHPLPDGTLLENNVNRQCKEIIYAYEIGCMLCHALYRTEEIKNLLPLMNKCYINGDPQVKTYLSSLMDDND